MTLVRRIARSMTGPLATAASPARRYDVPAVPPPRPVLPPPLTDQELAARDERYLACVARQDECERAIAAIGQ